MAKFPKLKFEVEVCRTSYSTRKITVYADNQTEAKELAIDTAGGFEFSEHDADYSVEWISKGESYDPNNLEQN